MLKIRYQKNKGEKMKNVLVILSMLTTIFATATEWKIDCSKKYGRYQTVTSSGVIENKGQITRVNVPLAPYHGEFRIGNITEGENFVFELQVEKQTPDFVFLRVLEKKEKKKYMMIEKARVKFRLEEGSPVEFYYNSLSANSPDDSKSNYLILSGCTIEVADKFSIEDFLKP